MAGVPVIGVLRPPDSKRPVFRRLLMVSRATPRSAAARRPGAALMKTAVSMLGDAGACHALARRHPDRQRPAEAGGRRARAAATRRSRTCASARRRSASACISEADIQFALSRQFAYAYLRKTPGDKRPLSDELVAAYQPFSPRVEQLRAIRSQLMLRWFDRAEERQVLTIVGAERGEGRSYLAANLAIVFSQLGERTLLVDADMREPRQHYLFHLENQIGFSTLLAGRSREEAIVRIPDLAGLSVLPAGPTPPNPLELLNRLNFDEFMIQAKGAYDVVIVDTPAMSSGEDAAMIAVRTGAALAVARSGTDPRRRLHRPRSGPDGRRRGRGRLGAERGSARRRASRSEQRSAGSRAPRRSAVAGRTAPGGRSRRLRGDVPAGLLVGGRHGIWQSDEQARTAR